jgi:hypothetical protein
MLTTSTAFHTVEANYRRERIAAELARMERRPRRTTEASRHGSRPFRLRPARAG